MLPSESGFNRPDLARTRKVVISIAERMVSLRKKSIKGYQVKQV